MHKPYHKTFKFLDWNLDAQNHQLQLHYEVEDIGKVTETFKFPQFIILSEKQESIKHACELIHLMCGVSYYKTGLAKTLVFACYQPCEQLLQFVKKTWFHGLAELAYENKASLRIKGAKGTKGIKGVRVFDLSNKSNTLTPLISAKQNTLVPIGGGKDSLVTIEELKQQNKDITLFMVGSSALIKDVVRHLDLPLIQVMRVIDAKLLEYNKTGKGFNGHVPVTAINSCIAVLTALLFDFGEIVFSNERSADSANTVNADGDLVNHQYSKSHEFEKNLSAIINTEISRDLNYYSQQRTYSELAILKKFSKYPQYFPIFSSCNRNFHIEGSRNKSGRWCCDCPKCRFVFLGLAPFVEKQQLLEIFKSNLLDDNSQKEGFSELLGLKGIKPFECVGEIEESQLAYNMIKNKTEWQGDCLIEFYRDKCPIITTEQECAIMQPTT